MTKKKILTVLCILVSFRMFAQSSEIDTVIFCKKAFPIPSSCGTPSKIQIFCNDYSMYWLYPAKSMLSSMVQTFVEGMCTELGSCKKDSMHALLLNENVSAIKLTFVVKGRPHYQFIGYGVVNKQPVVTILDLWKDPKKNEDLPGPIRQIFKLN